MNHFERALSDSDQALRSFTTDIEYLLKITAKLHKLGRLSLDSVHMMPFEKAVQESDLTRGMRVTPEVLGTADTEEPDFMTAINNRTSPFGEEKILYGDTGPDLFDMLNDSSDDDGSDGHIIKRGDE